MTEWTSHLFVLPTVPRGVAVILKRGLTIFSVCTLSYYGRQDRFIVLLMPHLAPPQVMQAAHFSIKCGCSNILPTTFNSYPSFLSLERPNVNDSLDHSHTDPFLCCDENFEWQRDHLKLIYICVSWFCLLLYSPIHERGTFQAIPTMKSVISPNPTIRMCLRNLQLTVTFEPRHNFIFL
jgi:hypothetical protein